MKRFLVSISIVAGAVLSAPGSAPGAPVGTALAYQGQLKQGGVPVNGTCDLAFSLWDAAAGPAQVGPTLTFDGRSGHSPPISVVNGLFTVKLDFGNAFGGDARWLEIAVCCPPGDCGGPSDLTTLDPRQELTPAPLALALPGLYTRQNATSPNLIGGHSGNSVTTGAVGATIGGGGLTGGENLVTDNYGTIGGGRRNQAGDDAGATTDTRYTTVGGGYTNTASGESSTVGGGWWNTASNDKSTVGGGESNTASDRYTTVGGGLDNIASGYGATVGGGDSNAASANSATVGGGESNTASGNRSTVGGGQNNEATWFFSTVGGGTSNTASGHNATVGGGLHNTASAHSAAVGGGTTNTADGVHATVPGGFDNTAGGAFSFAAGRRGKANHDGSFVWADSTDADFISTGPDQFLIRAAGNVGIGTTAPDAYLDVRPAQGTTPDEILKASSPADANYGSNDVAVIQGGPASGYTGTVLKVESRSNDSSQYALLDVRNNVANSPSSKLYVRGDGKVGIGVEDPEAKLHVDGQIKIKGGYYANGVLSSFGYHIDDCNGTNEKFVHMAAQGGVDYGLCMERYDRAADEWGDASNTCKMAGKRLPDYIEWRKACDGKTSGEAGTTDPFYSNITGDWEWASSRPGPTEFGLPGAGAVIAGLTDCAMVAFGLVRTDDGFNPHIEGTGAFRCVR